MLRNSSDMTRWPTSRRGLLLALAVATLSCASDIDSLDVPEFADGSIICSDAPALGIAGATSTESLPITWVEGSDAWYGEPIVVQVPADLTMVQVSVVAGPRWTGVAEARHNGELLIDGRNNFDGAPFFHYPAVAGSTMFPIDENSALSEGCLQLVPVSMTDPGGAGELYFASRRAAPGATFDLNVVVVGDTEVSREELEAAVAVANEIYAAAGSSTFANVSYETLSYPQSIFATPGESPSESFDELGQLLASYEPDDPRDFSLFVIQDFIEPGNLGIAAGIPGPNGIPGTGSSGLVVSVDSHLDDNFENLDLQIFGETIAHEIGHQLGLFHTTEARGDTHDPLEDTRECDIEEHDQDGDGELSAEECVNNGGDNVMFWTAGMSVSQDKLSPAQIELLGLSPIAD